MLKWAYFGLTSLFVIATLVMLNDMRLQVRASARPLAQVGELLEANLPSLVETTRQNADLIADHLPEVVERTRSAAEVLGELAEDIRQLKELAGLTQNPRDKNLIAYADSVLNCIESAGGVIGVSKNVGGGIKNTAPVKEWISSARKEALFLTLLVRSKKEMATRLTRTKLGFHWWIQPPGQGPMRLIEWLRAHHPETGQLDW
ncbi:MAG: hypothetical protein SNJ82_10935 [Gemmataceae bacterium]